MKQYLFLFLFLISICFYGCTDPTEQEANKAFAEKKYHKAFSLYKKAIQKKPTKDLLYRQLEKTSAHIVAQGITEVEKGLYKESIDTLSILAEDDTFPVGDARLLSFISHLHNYKNNIDDTEQAIASIGKGLGFMLKAISESKSNVPIVNLNLQLVNWLAEKGLPQELIQSNAFGIYDQTHIYRCLLLYDLVKQIDNDKNPSFPVPNDWEKQEKLILKSAYSIFSWTIHNIAVVEKDHDFYYPATIASTIMRGYATTEEQAVCFILLCLQKGIPAYLVETKSNGKSFFYALINFGKKWITFDFDKKIPVFQNNIPLDTWNKSMEYLKKNDQVNIQLVFSPQSVIPRISQLNHVYQLVNMPAPQYHYNIYFMAALLYQQMDKKLDEKTLDELLHDTKSNFSVGIYSKTIETWWYYNNREQQEQVKKWKKLVPISKQTNNMRMGMLCGDMETALFYSINTNNPDNQEFFDYYQALVFEKDNLEKAKKAFSTYLEKYPSGFWKNMAIMHLGQIAALQNDQSTAKENYTKLINSETLNFYIERQ